MSSRIITGNREFEVNYYKPFFKKNIMIGMQNMVVFRSIILFSNFFFKT